MEKDFSLDEVSNTEDKRIPLVSLDGKEFTSTTAPQKESEIEAIGSVQKNEDIKTPEVVDTKPQEVSSQKLEVEEAPKKVFSASVVNVSELVENQARDLADRRMTESKEDLSGSWVKRNLNRIWKHGVAQEYYRQKEISKIKKDINETGNLYAGETTAKDADHGEAMKSIVSRFVSEYEADVLKKEEIESKESVDTVASTKIKELILQYASSSTFSEASFREEQKRILAESGTSYNEKQSYTDNLLEIADQVKKSVEHGTRIDAMDFDIKISLGKAKEALNSEMKKNTFDAVFDKLQNSKVGKFLVNEPVAVGIASSLYSLGNFVGMKALQSNVAQIASFGGTALVASGITGLKESARLERERVQHHRERARGVEFDPEMKRRAKFEQSVYDMKNARSIIGDLHKDLETLGTKAVSREERLDIVARVLDLEARLSLGEEEKIDLVSFSGISTIEQERTEMLLARARLKSALRKMPHSIDGTSVDFEGLNILLADEFKQKLKEQEGGIEEKDRLFKKMKRKTVAKAMIKTALIGGTVGAAVQEVAAFIDPNIDGVVEGAYKSTFGNGALEERATALEGVRRFISGEMGTNAAEGGAVNIEIDGQGFVLPEGFDIEKEGEEYILSRDGEVILRSPELDSDILRAQGFLVEENFVTSTESVAVSPEEYVKDNAEDMTSVKREFWFDNDTSAFDKNELKTDWGGENGTGLDENGNYVFSVKRMVEGGSYQGINQADFSQDFKMLFSLSRETQSSVFELPVDANGNVVIDKDSDLGRALFAQEDGKAVFKGAFAEVAQVEDIEGVKNAKILSTVIGEGVSEIEEVVQTHVPITRVDVVEGGTKIETQFIPVPHRRPLEKGEEKESQYKKVLKEVGEVEREIKQPETLIRKEESVGTTAVKEEGVTPEEEGDEEVSEELENADSGAEKNKKFDYILQPEYDALRKDLDLLNKRIQEHRGIITVSEEDFASALGKYLYNKYKSIAPGKPVTFNREEFLQMGDEIEKKLSGSVIVKNATEYKDKISQEGLAKEKLVAMVEDIRFINQKIREGNTAITIKASDFASDYARVRFEEFKNNPEDTVNLARVQGLGDELEGLVSATKVAA